MTGLPQDKRPRTRSALRAREQLIWDLTYLNRERLVLSDLRRMIPKDWHTLEADVPVEEEKVKVTLYLDKSVARFFRAMGNGYQARINRLLRVWAQMKIADELRIDEMLQARVARDIEDEDDEV